MKDIRHNFHRIALLGLTVMLVTGCVTINLGGAPTAVPTKIPTELPDLNQPTEPQPPRAVLSDQVLFNMEYFSPMLQVPVKVMDGEYSGVVDGVELNVKIRSGIEYGDLNGDGIDDAAIILSENTGGSGIFVSLIVVYSQGEVFRQAPGVLIDDRPVINTIGIENGVVRISGLIHAPNDPMVNPTTTFTTEYTLFGEKMVQSRLFSAFAGGGEHAIFIDSPIDGEEVSASFNLKGSMPIGPFENNLSLMIFDPMTGQLVHEGFMVQAEDMGAPASFNNKVLVPGVPAGTQLLVMLLELSMADSTPITIDSVVVTVK